MSGSPVLLGQKVLGVLCGSVSTGGDIAWAMKPSEVNGGRAAFYGRAAGDIAWPSFSLLRDSAARDLLRSSTAKAESVQMVEQSASEWQAVEEAYSQLLATLAEAANEVRRSDKPVSQSHIHDLLAQYRNARDTRALHLAELNNGFMRMILSLGTANFPRTQYNRRLHNDLASSLDSSWLSSFSLEGMNESRSRQDAIRSYEEGTAVKQAGRPGLGQLIDAEKADLVAEHAAFEGYRREIVAAERMLFQEQWDRSWTYEHDGYQIAMPAGSTLAGKDLGGQEVAQLIDTFSPDFDELPRCSGMHPE